MSNDLQDELAAQIKILDLDERVFTEEEKQRAVEMAAVKAKIDELQAKKDAEEAKLKAAAAAKEAFKAELREKIRRNTPKFEDLVRMLIDNDMLFEQQWTKLSQMGAQAFVDALKEKNVDKLIMDEMFGELEPFYEYIKTATSLRILLVGGGNVDVTRLVHAVTDNANIKMLKLKDFTFSKADETALREMLFVNGFVRQLELETCFIATPQRIFGALGCASAQLQILSLRGSLVGDFARLHSILKRNKSLRVFDIRGVRAPREMTAEDNAKAQTQMIVDVTRPLRTEEMAGLPQSMKVALDDEQIKTTRKTYNAIHLESMRLQLKMEETKDAKSAHEISEHYAKHWNEPSAEDLVEFNRLAAYGEEPTPEQQAEIGAFTARMKRTSSKPPTPWRAPDEEKK